MKNTLDYENWTEEDIKNVLENKASELTVRNYKSQVNTFFRYLKPEEAVTIEDLKEFTTDDVRAWVQHLEKTGAKNNTINQKLQAMSKLYKVLMTKDYRVLDYNPFDTEEGIKRKPMPDFSTGRRISDKELRLLAEYFESDRSILGLRNQIIFNIFLTTGMRSNEVLSQKIGNIESYDGQYVFYSRGKFGKEHITVISAHLKRLIDKYISRSCWDYTMKDQYLFPSRWKENSHITNTGFDKTLVKACKAVGIETVNQHDFRHTYITMSLEMGEDIFNVQKRVHHASVEATRRYDHTFRIINGNPADDIFAKYNKEDKDNQDNIVAFPVQKCL